MGTDFYSDSTPHSCGATRDEELVATGVTVHDVDDRSLFLFGLLVNIFVCELVKAKVASICFRVSEHSDSEYK